MRYLPDSGIATLAQANGLGILVSPTRRRNAVQMFRVRSNISERIACRVVGQPRTTQSYEAAPRADESALTHAIVELASLYGRYGYRTILACCRATREECNDANLNALPQAF